MGTRLPVSEFVPHSIRFLNNFYPANEIALIVYGKDVNFLEVVLLYPRKGTSEGVMRGRGKSHVADQGKRAS